MRLPRHDTPLTLPAEPPREALARDEALLDSVQPGGPVLERWYVAASPAVVVGLGLRHRIPEIVDLERCHARAVDVFERRAGGGALLLDRRMLCGAICVPHHGSPDITESYRWLGDALVQQLHALGVAEARSVDVPEARADVAALAGPLLTTCFGALSPHEVVVGAAKLVGLAQIRRRHAALFQVGILLEDQSPLADFLRVPDEPARTALRAALARRTVGLAQLLQPLPDPLTLSQRMSPRSAFAAASAAADATPSAP